MLEQLEYFGVARDPEANILGSFPLESRRVFAQHTTELVLSEKVPASDLSSHTHVTFIMECIGQSFGLPVDDRTQITIEEATEIYRRWLFNSKRPAPINTDRASIQKFYRKTFRHFSLLFSPKLSNESTLEVHAKLCSNVLSILKTLSEEVGTKEFTIETWEELVMIMLGVADVVYSGKDSSSSLGTKIGLQFWQNILELFLISNTKNDTLWQKLKTQIAKSIERKPTVKHWANIMASITKRLMRLLYGPNEGTDDILLSGSFTSTQIKGLEDDFVYYIWYRLLYIIGPFWKVENPQIHLDLMKGITACVEIFLSVGYGTIPEKQRPRIDGNTILHIYGTFLFDGIQRVTKSGFEAGKAEGIASLCRIFSFRKTSRFLPKYMTRFYQILAAGLQDQTLRAVVLINSYNLLHAELRGSRVLIPYFLQAIGGIFKGEKNALVAEKQLHAACIKIAGFMICLSNHFNDVKFVTFEHPIDSQITTYSSIKKYLVADFFFTAFKREDDAINRHSLLWTITVFIYEHLTTDTSPDFLSFRNNFISMLLNQLTVNDWPLESKIIALKVVSEMAILGGSLVVTKDLATYVTLHLTSFATAQHGKKEQGMDDLISEVFSTFLHWTGTGQWLFQQENCLKKILHLIELYITPRVGKTAEAAEVLLLYILNHVDNFPPPTGPQSVSSYSREAHIDAKMRKGRQMQTYIFDHTIFSVLRYPKDPNNTVTLILHNTTGRQVWNMTQHYSPISTPVSDPPGVESSQPLKTPAPHALTQEKGIKEPINSVQMKQQKSMLKYCKSFGDEEAALLNKKNYGLDAKTVCAPPRPPNLESQSSEETDNTLMRTWLSNWGFLTSQNWCTRIVSADIVPALKHIDNMRERQSHTVGILYTRKGIPETSGRSTLFHDFLSVIGWKSKEERANLVYYSYDEEVHFQLIGSPESDKKDEKDEKKSDKKQEYYIWRDRDGEKENFKSEVAITWAEEFTEFFDVIAIMSKNHGISVNITIMPLNSGLFHIKIHKKEGLARFGPLQDGMVVSKDILATTVRQTAINASHVVHRFRDPAFVHPLIARRRELNEFITKNRTRQPDDEWAAGQFVSREKD